MTSLIFVGDPHYRVKGSPYRIDNFYETQLDKLKQILKLGEVHKSSGIIFLGDIFHSPRESYELVYNLLEVFKTTTVPCYSIVGNHDVVGYSIDTLKRSPLGILTKSGFVTLLNQDIVFGDNVVLRGIDYFSKHEDQKYQFNGYGNYTRVICSHNMIVPLDKALFDFIHPNNVQTDADLVMMGHYHMPFDFTTPNSKRFINPGVPMRWTTNEVNIVPKVVKVEFSNNTYKVDYLPLQYKKDVFDLTTPQEIKTSSQEIENFVQTLEATTFGSTNLEESIAKYGVDQGIEPIVVQELLRRIKESRGACESD